MRDGGLWDLEAELIDVKAYDFPKRDGEVFKAGDPIHHMHLRITIDGDFTIVAAQAMTRPLTAVIAWPSNPLTLI